MTQMRTGRGEAIGGSKQSSHYSCTILGTSINTVGCWMLLDVVGDGPPVILGV